MDINIVPRIAPVVNPISLVKFAPYWGDSLLRWGIKSPSSIGAFISNLAVESAHFLRTLEYASGAEYEGRADLGNTIKGDGIKFKGRGLIQLTGRTVYKQYSLDHFGDTRLLDHPELLEAPELALDSACWFWSRYKDINKFCTTTSEDFIHPGVHQYTKFQWITILVNGGLNGYDERFDNYKRARQILNF